MALSPPSSVGLNGVTITDTPSAGEILTATSASAAAWSAAAGGWDATVRKTADESVANNTTPQDDDELFFTAANGTPYIGELIMVYGSPVGAGTPDIKVALGEDATARGWWLFWGPNTADTLTVTMVSTNQTAGAAGTAAANRILWVPFTHLGAGGTFKFQWSQNTSGGNPTIVRAGSLLRYKACS